MKHLGTTPPFRGPQSETFPGSIAEIRYLRLGGLDQWDMIRGASVANPPLILLHDGPGFPEMRLFRHFNSPLEKSFTVVYWEHCGRHDHVVAAETSVADFDRLTAPSKKFVWFEESDTSHRSRNQPSSRH